MAELCTSLGMEWGGHDAWGRNSTDSSGF